MLLLLDPWSEIREWIKIRIRNTAFLIPGYQSSKTLVFRNGDKGNLVFFSLFLGDPEFGWVGADGAGDNWLQDEAERAGAGGLAQHPQLLLQRLVERPRLQAHAGLPQV